jgi:hypothetical protein
MKTPKLVLDIFGSLIMQGVLACFVSKKIKIGTGCSSVSPCTSIDTSVKSRLSSNGSKLWKLLVR